MRDAIERLPRGVAWSDTVSARILQFVSRREQVRQRGAENYARWKRITKGLESYGPRERHRTLQQHAENEAKDREWAIRHAPGPDGAVIHAFCDEELGT
jgi:hypothetical protein